MKSFPFGDREKNNWSARRAINTVNSNNEPRDDGARLVAEKEAISEARGVQLSV